MTYSHDELVGMEIAAIIVDKMAAIIEATPSTSEKTPVSPAERAIMATTCRSAAENIRMMAKRGAEAAPDCARCGHPMFPSMAPHNAAGTHPHHTATGCTVAACGCAETPPAPSRGRVQRLRVGRASGVHVSEVVHVP